MRYQSVAVQNRYWLPWHDCHIIVNGEIPNTHVLTLLYMPRMIVMNLKKTLHVVCISFSRGIMKTLCDIEVIARSSLHIPSIRSIIVHRVHNLR